MRTQPFVVFFPPSETIGCAWGSVIHQTPRSRSWLTSTTGKATPSTTKWTTAPCLPWLSWKRSRWRGSTSLTAGLGENTAATSLFVSLPCDFLVKNLISFPSRAQVALVLLAGPARSGRTQLLFGKRLREGEGHGHNDLQTNLQLLREGLPQVLQDALGRGAHASREQEAVQKLRCQTGSCDSQPGGRTRTQLHTQVRPRLTLFPPQLVFSSEPWTTYLQTQVKSLCNKEQLRGDNRSFITVSTSLRLRSSVPFASSLVYRAVLCQVNGVTKDFSQPGYFLVSVDACSGKVIKTPFFSKLDAKMEQYLKSGIPKR